MHNLRLLKRFIIIYTLLTLLVIPRSWAEDVKDTLKVGFYVNNIYDIDYKKGTYKLSLFIWTISKKKIYALDDYLDFSGKVEYNQYLNHEEVITGINSDTLYWSEIEAQLEILQEYNANKFPFDKEKIQLLIEFTDDDSDSTIFEIDNSSILDKVSIPNGWKLSIKPYIKKYVTSYPTSFGDPRLNSYNVNTVSLTYVLSRDSFALFLKMFVVLFISFMIACSSIFISNDSFEPRFGLIVGGLFGTISNKYITDSFLPESTSLNLSDKLHLLTITYLLIMTIVTIIENRFKLEDNPKYEKYMFFGILISYIGFVSLMIFYN